MLFHVHSVSCDENKGEQFHFLFRFFLLMNFVRRFDNLPSKAVLPTGEQISRQINRGVLRFDQEFRSSINLDTQNLYMCLSCGKIYTGGKLDSQIIAHFGETAHTIALNLENHKFVILPSFEFLPPMKELFDIEFSCSPYYNDKVFKEILEKQKTGILNPNKNLIFPGAMCFDINPAISSQLSTLRFFTRITPIRDILLSSSPEMPLSYNLSKFLKQFCNPFTFQDLISPFNVLYAIQEMSNHEFLIDKECDPTQFLAFILNTLTSELGKEKIAAYLRGSIEIIDIDEDNSVAKQFTQRFWCLPLDPMESPLYRTGLEKEKIIPRVELSELMNRYNGESIITQISKDQQVKQRKMKIKAAKEFLWLNVNRIRPSVFDKEKLTLHIALPRDYLDLTQYGVKSKYQIIAIIAHEGDIRDGYYLTYIRNEAGVWLKCGVTEIEVTFEEIALNSQCCHLLYQKI